jgi:hypothetical protein
MSPVAACWKVELTPRLVLAGGRANRTTPPPAHHPLRCFPQRNIETPVGDVVQPSAVATEIFQEHPPQIPRDLLANRLAQFPDRQVDDLGDSSR